MFSCFKKNKKNRKTSLKYLNEENTRNTDVLDLSNISINLYNSKAKFKQKFCGNFFIDNILFNNNPFTGIINDARICYLSSLLQVFYSIPEYFNFFTKLDENIIENSNLAYEIKKFMLFLHENNLKKSDMIKIPSSFLSIINEKFQLFQSHDISELYEYILKIINIPDSIENNLFNLEINSEKKCLNCNFIIKNEIKSNIIYLNIHYMLDIQTAFDNEFNYEVDETVKYCNNCNNRNKFLLKNKLKNKPQILAIILKNECNNTINSLNFLNDLIIEETNSKYFLECFIEFLGNIYSGHYIAYCKKKQKWYVYNDSLVREISEEKIIKKTKPLLLFYRLSNFI